jgi:hypothetical protein
MKINAKKIVPIVIILLILISTGVGVVIYQYSQQKRTDSPTDSEPTLETVPTDTTQISNSDEITKTMPSYQSVKMKEVNLASKVSSFRVKWEMKGYQTEKYIEIGNTVQFSDNDKVKHSTSGWAKIKEIEVDKSFDKARFCFDLKTFGGIGEIRVNGNKIGKTFGTLLLSDFKSFTQDLTGLDIKKGDKIQLWLKTKEEYIPLIGKRIFPVSAQNFQIKYNIKVRVLSSRDVYHQIKVDGIPKTNWNSVNSEDYKLVEIDINSRQTLQNITVELWVKAALGVEVSVRNMEICYNVK